MDTITHLGHVLSYNLDDTSDIIRATKDMTQKANFVQCAFPFADLCKELSCQAILFVYVW